MDRLPILHFEKRRPDRQNSTSGTRHRNSTSEFDIRVQHQKLEARKTSSGKAGALDPAVKIQEIDIGNWMSRTGYRGTGYLRNGFRELEVEDWISRTGYRELAIGNWLSGDWISGAGYRELWVSGTGYRELDFGSWISGAGYRELDVEDWILGDWISGAGYRGLDIEDWIKLFVRVSRSLGNSISRAGCRDLISGSDIRRSNLRAGS